MKKYKKYRVIIDPVYSTEYIIKTKTTRGARNKAWKKHSKRKRIKQNYKIYVIEK